MFVGHYGPGFAIKAADSSIPLWVVLFSVQLVDVSWATLVLLGIEKVRIVPGITAASPLDLYYMPYTHSLIGSLAWAAAAVLAYRFVPRLGDWKAGLLVGAAVFSHWILDLVAHRPDLPLYDDTIKVGLGLWNYPVLEFALEAVLLFGGIYIYLARTRAVAAAGRYGMIIFGAAMLGIQLLALLGPPPGSDKELAATSLLAYAIFPAVSYWLEKKRVPIRPSPPR